ncbi:class I SAM-dependent methyltransferase [Chloroflexi bacterium TSY]|nr:class I SAM-dependent methyltransferase [Chloroflexi bacterium TSY]
MNKPPTLLTEPEHTHHRSDSQDDVTRSDINGMSQTDCDTQRRVDIFDRFARFYDQDYRNYEADLDLVVELAQKSRGPVLELGCGTGRALVPLAANGIQVTGIDISPALLSIARAKLEDVVQAQKVPPIQIIEDDIRSFSLLKQQFGFAYCVSNTLMHCESQEDQLAVLHNVHRHLALGGLLLIDLFNPDIARLIEIEGVCELADQWRDPTTEATVFKWSVRSLDLAEQLQDTLFIYEEILPDGAVRRTSCPFTLRFLWRSEGELMLSMAGFKTEAVWGDFDGQEYDSRSERLIFLARKV